MAANDNGWIVETVADFIHSPIWRAPIQTFIEEHCAAFDYDDEEENDGDGSSGEEQKQIFIRYEKLVDSLLKCRRCATIWSWTKNYWRKPVNFLRMPRTADLSTNPSRQLYSAKDFTSFQDMMRRKNLILQLQALVSLQLQWGLLKHSQTGDDLILTLLLEATKSPSPRGSVDRTGESTELSVPSKREIPAVKPKDDDDDDDVVVVEKKSTKVPSARPRTPPSTQKKREKPVQPEKPAKESYRLPDLRRREDLNADWYRKLRANDDSVSSTKDSGRRSIRSFHSKDDDEDDRGPKSTSIPQSIGNVSEDVLRQKLKELTDQTTSSVDDKTAAAIKSRKDFLQTQRKLLLDKRHDELKQDLEQETRTARPQSAAHVARKAMSTASSTKQSDASDQSNKPTDEEIAKRRALTDRLRRDVIHKS